MDDEKNMGHGPAENEETLVTRRNFFGKLGSAAIGAVALGGAAPAAAQRLDGKERIALASSYEQRALDCYNYRVGTAKANLPPPNQPRFDRLNNGDEALYPNRIGNYSKCLPHQANGEVVPAAYNAFLNAVNSGSAAAFEQIPMGGDRKLTSPQAGLAYDLEGPDSFSMVQPPPPAFASREIAAEICENYWMALLRDVPFTQYSGNAIANAAAADLTLFGADFKGPKSQAGNVTPELLFRGLTPGDAAGPYLSQFWYLPCFFGPNQIDRRFLSARSLADGGQNYMTDFNSWLAVQNGVSPAGIVPDPILRYPRSGRDIGEWVHVDMLFQAYYQSFLCMVGLGVPFDEGNPYQNSVTQEGFATFGFPHIATILCEVASRALKVVWNQKWFVHRRLRPEAFAGRIDRTLYHGANYPVHPEIMTSLTTQTRLGAYMPSGNAFLPMAFPEGCPTHPAYGAGHATVAGACTTILKAWFKESTVIQQPVVPDPTGQVLVPYTGDTLTVGGELNKVASNVANGRNIAGVHWRSDSTESLKLGEALAIGILRDQKRSYNEAFTGFNLTKFDGSSIIV